MVSTKISTKPHIKWLAIPLLIVVGVGVGAAKQNIVHAQFDIVQSICSQDKPSYQANGQLPGGDYDVYVRFGRLSDNAQAKVYLERQEVVASPSVDNSCIEVGQGFVTGENWTRIGTVTEPEGLNIAQVVLQTDFNYGDTDGGAPVVVFVAKNSAKCDLSKDCVVDYQGQKMELTPRKISLSLTGMRLGLVAPLSNEKPKEVIYSVDSLPVYKKKILTDFDVNYVPNGKHNIERTIVFESGYKLSDSKVIERGDSAGFDYTVRAYVYRHMYSIAVVLLTLTIMIVVSLVLSILRYFYHRHAWQLTHVLRPELPVEGAGPSTDFGHESNIHYLWRMRRVFYIFFGIIFVTFASNIFVITTFTVDGVSMYPTLQDKSQKYLLKLPKTIKDFNHTIYIPNRGDIVVVQNVDNGIFFGTPINSRVYVVKRVIGLPGEHVVVKDGIIKIYSQDRPDGFEPDKVYNWMKDTPVSKNFVVDINLKAGEIFVVGDNRTESIDSRSFGPVSAEQVVGLVIK